MGRILIILTLVKNDPLVLVSRKSRHMNCYILRKSCSDSCLSFFKLGTGDMEGMTSIAEYREPSRFTNWLSTF